MLPPRPASSAATEPNRVIGTAECSTAATMPRSTRSLAELEVLLDHASPRSGCRKTPVKTLLDRDPTGNGLREERRPSDAAAAQRCPHLGRIGLATDAVKATWPRTLARAASKSRSIGPGGAERRGRGDRLGKDHPRAAAAR